MAGKKDNVIVAVISDLTREQAGQIMKDIMKSKGAHAPTGRGTIATGKKEDVGKLIQQGNRRRINNK